MHYLSLNGIVSVNVHIPISGQMSVQFAAAQTALVSSVRGHGRCGGFCYKLYGSDVV